MLQKIMVFLLLLGIAAFAYYLQTEVVLSGDIAYLLHVSNQLLEGGTYVTDFFETNPPMILYFYIPVCLLLKLFAPLSIIHALKAYIYCLVLCSLFVCNVLLHRVFRQQKQFVFGLSAAFVFVLLFQPAHQFAQREHIFMIFVSPYLLSLVLTLEQRPLSRTARFVITFFAAIGIALKPYFLIPIILIELYFIYLRRSLLACVRFETLLMLSIFIIYLSSIFIFHPNYFKLLFPLIYNFYFIGFEEPWLIVLVNYDVLYCVFAALVFFVLTKMNKHKHFTTVMFLAMLGMVAAFVVPRMPWTYHVMPALSFAIILLTYYFIAIFQAQRNNGYDFIIYLLTGLFFYLYPLYSTIYFYHFFINVKNDGDLYRLTSYITRQPDNHSITCFSTFTTTCFPLIYVSNSYRNQISQFPFFWWVPGMLKWDQLPKNKIPETIFKQKQFILQQFIADFKHLKPMFVVMHTEDLNILVNKHFNYIDYFSQDKKFRDEWRNYHLIKTIDYYKIYKRTTKE